jgi:hypothetical protein
MNAVRRNTIRLSAMAMCLALVFDAPCSRAQSAGDQPAATQPARQSRTRIAAAPVDPTILAGPEVEEDAELREGPRLRQLDNPRGPNDEVPFGAWISTLRGLDLSPQQGSSIRQIAREFEEKARAFRDAQPEDVKWLMREVRQAREQGLPPPPEAREKLATIERDMPRPQPYQERIWALLTKEQQDQMKAKLDAIRNDMARRQGPRDSMTPVAMTDDANGVQVSAGDDARPTGKRSARRAGWRFWLLDPFPAQAPTPPATTQPDGATEPDMMQSP